MIHTAAAQKVCILVGLPASLHPEHTLRYKPPKVLVFCRAASLWRQSHCHASMGGNVISTLSTASPVASSGAASQPVDACRAYCGALQDVFPFSNAFLTSGGFKNRFWCDCCFTSTSKPPPWTVSRRTADSAPCLLPRS